MDTSTAECRLCLSQKDLVLVFNCDDVGLKTMKELILLTTGVEILEKDVISRKICTHCSKFVIKMHEFRERSIKTDKYLKEKCIEHLRATEMKIPNTNVTITTTKQLRKDKLDDSNHNNHSICQNELNELDGSEKDENFIILDSYSLNSDIPQKVKVHETVSELFTRNPNLKLRSDVLAFDLNPFISLELDAVEQYCSDNNINLKLAAERANSNCSSEESISRDNLKEAQFKIISNDSSTRKRKSSESNETVAATQQSKVKKRRLPSSDFIPDTDQSNPTLFETLGLKPSSSKKTKTHKCNICLSVHKSAKVLKFHYQEHFYCNFCKARFKLIERRISHEKKCTVGHALNSKPYVELTKVDLDLNITNKYLLHNCNAGINTNSIHCNEVIELSDDDEPVIKSTSITNVRVVGTEFSSIEKVTNVTETELNTVTTYSPAKSNTSPQSPAATVGNNEILPQIEVSDTPNAEVLPVQYASTAIVRPDVRIKGDILLNKDNLNGSDIVLLKELLQNAKRVVSKSLKEPTSKEITRNGTMKNMFLQLALYKVPVNIRHGQHCVTISGPESETNKEVTMWNHKTPLPLINRKTNTDITNITLKPSETVPTNSPATNNNPASETALTNTVKTDNRETVHSSVSVQSIVNDAISKIYQTIENMLMPNTESSQTHCSSQDQTKVNMPSQSSVPVTFPNGVQTAFPQRFIPNFLNTSNAHLLNSRHNNSPVNSNASSPQILPHAQNNVMVNNLTNNSRQQLTAPSSTSINSTNGISQVFRSPNVTMTGSNHRSILRPNNNSPLNSNVTSQQIVLHTPNNVIVNNMPNSSQQQFTPLSSTSINSTNGMSQVFRSPNATMIGSNHPSILRPGSNPLVTDSTITNYNRLSAPPNQNNVQFTYSNSNNRQITLPLLNNESVILNPLVANRNTTQNEFTNNNIPENTLNVPMIRVKSIHELK
ncbi:GATA zinc finger domain-containing protein 14-like isoform X8 [Diabrotica virgifera virgifera]|uniref:ZAD domain-containing protein n=1 Tax=Diabrotica virgifera virgifera TaxID=50390 RepID=A0ABM5KVV1_DIAVI|nr:GATA zinc finger domain-containing protein 14-like isoform X8 [Diabrotica virgifera virgifera]